MATILIDVLLDMTFESIRNFEHQIQTSTNEKVRAGNSPPKGEFIPYHFRPTLTLGK